MISCVIEVRLLTCLLTYLHPQFLGRIARTALMWPTAIDSVICLSVSLSVCWAQGWALQKRLNRSRCRLGDDIRRLKEPCIRWVQVGRIHLPPWGVIRRRWRYTTTTISVKISDYISSQSLTTCYQHPTNVSFWHRRYHELELWAVVAKMITVCATRRHVSPVHWTPKKPESCQLPRTLPMTS